MVSNALNGRREDGRVLAFGDFELDEAALALRRAGQPVEISTRPLRVLAFLCRERHRFVTKQELLDAVWGDTAVSEASIFTALREIRGAAGRDGGRRSALRAGAAPHADRFAAAGHAQACPAPMAGTLGVLAGLAGWHDRADDHFGRALEACDGIDSSPLAARARLHWARALSRRETRDGARISELLWEALQLARPIGMQAVVERAERMLEEGGHRRRRGSA